MKKLFPFPHCTNLKLIALLFLIFIPPLSAADSINVTGIDGLVFEEQPNNYQIVITDSFKLHNMKVTPSGLTLQYKTLNKTFKIFGRAKIFLENDSISISLGDSINPGILITNGTLDNVGLSITADFKLKNTAIIPEKLFFIWNHSTYQYKIFGNIEIQIDNHLIIANLGTSVFPGIEIDSGRVNHINVGITGNLSLRSLAITPTNLSLMWDRDSSFYKMYGDISIKLAEDTLFANLGTDKEPGVILTNGIVTKLDISLTANFTLKKLVFKPRNLTFDWDEASKRIKIFGEILVKIESDSLYAVLGNSSTPGIQVTSGVIDNINIAVTGNFSLKSLAVKPDSLVFIYDSNLDKYKIFGALELDIESDTIKVGLGTFNNPGIEIIDGILDKINFEVTTSFKLKSLAIKPDSLTFVYDRDSSQYKIYGNIEIDVEKDTIKAQLGSFDDPGISITDGKVDHINISISSDFELKKLTIETDSLGIEWQKSLDGGVYHFFGNVKIDIDTNKIAFNFGSRSHPGVVVRNGKIDTLKISTTDDIHFAGFEVGTQNLTLEYSNELYQMYGKLFLKKMWSAEIDLGNGPGSGITLDLSIKPAKLMIEHAVFELANVDLGPITLKNITLALEENRVQSANLKVDLPPGWEVDAMMGFKFSNGNLEIDSVDIDWEALNIDEAIAIPGTGAFITKLNGGLFGIEDPHEFKVTGDIGIAFGGPFNIPDVGDVSLLFLEANASISRSEFIIDSYAYMGAYKKSDGTWASVLGDGNLKLDLKWGDYYSIDGNLNIPSNPWTILKADLEAKLSQGGAFNAHIGVELEVPPKIPIVGGHVFAKADGVVHYAKTDPTSYAAGWAKLDLGFYTWHGGVKYKFQTKDYSTIGSKEISQLSTTTIGQSGDGYVIKFIDHISITVDPGTNPEFIQVKVKLKQKLSAFYLDVRHSFFINGSCFSPVYLVTGVDLITESGMNISSVPTFVSTEIDNRDSIIFYIMAPGYQSSSKATLPAGNYYVDIPNEIGTSMIKEYEVHKIYAAPWAVWTYNYVDFVPASADTLSNILMVPKLNYHTRSEVYNVDSSTVSLFFTKHQNKNGTLIKTFKYSDYWGDYPPDGEYLKIENIDFPQNITNGDSLFLYLTIDDGINSVYKSPVQYWNYTPPLQAKVNIQGYPDSLASGIETKLYILNPSDNNWYLPDTLKRFSNNEGEVSFPYALSANTKVKFVFDVPVGYEVDPTSSYKNGEETMVDNYQLALQKSVNIFLRKKNNTGGLYVR